MAGIRDSLALIPLDDGQAFVTCDLKVVAEGFLESSELLEECAPIWYTAQHHKHALTRGANESVARTRLGTAPRVSALQVRNSTGREPVLQGRPRPAIS